MPRSYMRLDPYWYDRKVLGIDRHGTPIEGWRPYPADALVAFMGVLALAELQPERGRFRSIRLLRELLRGGNDAGERYARQVSYLVKRGDVVVLGAGQLYVDGWDEWQEGDVPPPARIAAIARKRGDPDQPSPGALRQRLWRERHPERYETRHSDALRDASRDVTPQSGTMDSSLSTETGPRRLGDALSDALGDAPAGRKSRRNKHGDVTSRVTSVEAEAVAVGNSGGVRHASVTSAEARGVATAPVVKMTDDERAEARASMQAILDSPQSHPAARVAAEKALVKLNGAAHPEPAPEPLEPVESPPPVEESASEEAAHG